MREFRRRRRSLSSTSSATSTSSDEAEARTAKSRRMRSPSEPAAVAPPVAESCDDAMLCDAAATAAAAAATPRARRATASGNSMSRVATLMRRESRPFDDELAHESATMAFLNRITPVLLDNPAQDSPPAAPPVAVAEPDLAPPPPTLALAAPVDPASLGLSAEEIEAIPQLPRTIPIPISHLKDPASYASHTSKLNPENNLSIYRPQYDTASPIMSPNTHTSMILSPIVGKNKRKLSIGSEDRYEPYKRRANSGMPPSPSAMFMSPTTQPMSLPSSPSVNWLSQHPPPAPPPISTSSSTANPSASSNNPNITVATPSSSTSGGSTPMNITSTTPTHHPPSSKHWWRRRGLFSNDWNTTTFTAWSSHGSHAEWTHGKSNDETIYKCE
ncbi:hypothetical protein BDR26DRAFT_372729 [Obelidium mucronatum]|nr:hypothetical protein BDR26DRAFT_372729 [Obelidium mucronatum]